MFICTHCNKFCKNQNSLRNHERLCQKNPNKDLRHLEMAKSNRLKGIEATQECQHCSKMFSKGNICRHIDACKKNPKNIKECPVCFAPYTGRASTCGYSCSNKLFHHSNVGGSKYKADKHLIEINDYRQLCFRYHKKKCIICEEDKIVAVHHVNENHNDNSPENLIPMCPTHHQYMHSAHRELIEEQVKDYLRNWVIG